MYRAIAAGLLLASGTATADLTMEYSDGTAFYLSGKHAAMGAEDHQVLFEEGNETFIVIDHKRRTWMEMDENFGNDMRSAIDEQMKEMLAQLPPEQREMVKRQMQNMPNMMGGAMNMEPPKMTVHKTGKTDKVAGYKCSEATIDYGGMHEEKACIATLDELGLKKSDFDALASAMASIAKMSGRDNKRSPMSELDEMGGIPIRSSSGPNDRGHELTRLHRDKVDKSRFEIPDGYRKVSMADMMN